MAGIGVPELAIVLVIIVIIFGVGKLPEIGGALGKGIREFKTESTPEQLEAQTKEGLDSAKANGSSVLNSASDKVRESEPVKAASSRADEI